MRLWGRRRQADPEPPRGIVLRWDGREIPCAVIRDESLDKHGIAFWVAVPAEPVTIGPHEDYRVYVSDGGYLPDNCEIIADFTVPLDEHATG